jgi:hypothetical protein
MSNAWDILGVEKGASEEDIRKAFRMRARKLHPDKGGSASEFRELYEAYNTLRDKKYIGENSEDDEWLGWLGRWAKRFLGTDDRILRVKIPYKLLEDREQSITMEYDGIPVKIDLTKTETVTFGGVRIKLIPNAYIFTEETDVSGGNIDEDEEGIAIKEDPWYKDSEWLFMVPANTKKFKIKGGEWSSRPGNYNDCGVVWIRKEF